MAIALPSYELHEFDRSLLLPGYNDGDPIRFTFDESDLSDAVFSLRDAFVREMGWRPSEERDPYDDDGRTLHYATVKNEQVAASMRLTPVDAFEDALSVQMLQGDLAAAQAAREFGATIRGKVSQGEVWDLTRVVAPSDDSVSQHAILAGLCEIFGAAYVDTHSDTSDVVWVFTTTRSMKLALEHLGIAHETIASGHLSDKDRESGAESFFCVTSPGEAFRRVLESPNAYRFTVKYTSHGMEVASRHTTAL